MYGKYTCLKSNGAKVPGAITGSEDAVLAWMRKKFPGLHRPDDDLLSAFEFFYDDGYCTRYLTSDGEEVFLAERR